MATKCPRCGKKPIMSTTRILLRGHYNPTSKSKRYPNLQWAKVPDKMASASARTGGWRRIKICTDCIKTLHKTAHA